MLHRFGSRPSASMYTVKTWGTSRIFPIPSSDDNSTQSRGVFCPNPSSRSFSFPFSSARPVERGRDVLRYRFVTLSFSCSSPCLRSWFSACTGKKTCPSKQMSRRSQTKGISPARLICFSSCSLDMG